MREMRSQWLNRGNLKNYQQKCRGIYRAFRSFPFTPFWCNFLLFPLFNFPPLNLHVSIFPHTFCSSIFVDGYDKVLDRLYIERKRSHPIIFLGVGSGSIPFGPSPLWTYCRVVLNFSEYMRSPASSTDQDESIQPELQEPTPGPTQR